MALTITMNLICVLLVVLRNDGPFWPASELVERQAGGSTATAVFSLAGAV
ncbi:hypothetical protein P4113_27735 [Pseudomonas aeruginosa]|nr:hypothetical protein [Pseudomonas aeruginosa]